MSDYTVSQLNALIATARRLGYWDDVAHWEAEKRRMIEGSTA